MATHFYLNATGGEAEKIEDAYGVRYFVDDKQDFASPAPHFDYQLNEETLRMFAAFGARTLVTNTVSSFYAALPKGAAKGSSRPRKGEAPVDDISGLSDRFAMIVAGDWGAERGGGGGVGYNIEDLCEAIAQIMADSGSTINREKVLGALKNGGKFKGADLDDKAYRKQVLTVANPAGETVKTRYEAIRAAKVVTAPVDAAEVASDFE